MSELDNPVDAFDTDAELDRMLLVVRQMFGIPQTPEAAIRLVLMAKAAVTPLLEVTREQDSSNVEWLLPNTVDAVERAAAALQEAVDELESVVDDVGVIEAGTPMDLVDEGPQRGLPR